MAEMTECQGSYLDFDGSFLKDLPRSIKRYTFHGKSQFLDILESESARFEAATSARLESSTDTSEFVLFHISKETIEELFDFENEDTSITGFCTSFDTNEQLLLASMPSWPHGAVGPEMDNYDARGFQTDGLIHRTPQLSQCNCRREESRKTA